MTLLATPGAWIDAGSGVLLLGLGLAMARLRPRRRATMALAVFAACFGLVFLLINLDDGDAGGAEAMGGALRVPAAASLVLLGLWFPGLQGFGGHRRAGPAAAVAGCYVAYYVASAVILFPATAMAEALRATLLGAFAFVLVLIPWRAAEADPGTWKTPALLALALAPYPTLRAGLDLAGAHSYRTDTAAAFGRLGLAPDAAATAALLDGVLASGVPFLLVAVVLWLRAAARAPRPGSRWARDAAIWTAAGLAAGAAAGALAGPGAEESGLMGMVRILTVLVVAYAALRHQLLGLDVKVRWTVQQSTVAAAFVGVFFVASESASTFFASTDLGPYMGIAAAGLLVFALAPLQRAAERVASAAMPGVAEPAGTGRGDRATLYREHLALAYQDGAVSRDERRHLELARRHLGLTEAEASALEAEVLGGSADPEGL